MPEKVRYRVSMPQPNNHLFEVEARFPPQGDTLVLALPVWTPGSYLVREFSRHTQEFRAFDASGVALKATRRDKRSFLVECGGGEVRLTYRVYAHELSVRTSHLDATHGYFNGATLFYYAESLRNRRHELTIDAPDGWRVHTALESEGTTFWAADYDAFIDAPVEVSAAEARAFHASGVPHTLVTWGEPNVDYHRVLEELPKVVDTCARLWGELPSKRYLFVLHASDKVRGGLEHGNATTLMFPRDGFSSARGWEDFIALCAHEYFHLWCGKRLQPRRFIPFDYAQENYTSLLWFFEGATSYYDSLLVCRAGLMRPDRYLARLGETISDLESTPGRKVLPLAEASELAWIKHYRPDENTLNSAVSYYVKGEVVSALLDLTIRDVTRGERSLDDVLRLLWKRYGSGEGVPEDGIELAASEVASRDLSPFFAQALRGTEELDFTPFASVGLELKRRVRESPGDRGGTAPRDEEEKAGGWIGVLGRSGHTIAAVIADSPAMRAGLAAGDEVVAVDGQRCDVSGLVARCAERAVGDAIKVSFFRRASLGEATLALAVRPLECAWLSPMENQSLQQRAAYAAWLGVPPEAQH